MSRRRHVTTDQEREGWQLLLWSYRSELGVESTHSTRAELEGCWVEEAKACTGELADDPDWARAYDKAGEPGPILPPPL